jgi:hypothetical protein
MGSLDEESFHTTPDGWEATYVDSEPGTGVNARYRGDTLWLDQSWRGHRYGPIAWSRNEWDGLALYAAGMFPPAWNDAAKERLESVYNVFYFPFGPDTYTIAGYPDGFFVSIVVPTPVRLLRNALDFQRSTAADGSFARAAMSHLGVGWTATNYIRGLDEPLEAQLLPLLLHVIRDMGMPLTNQPAVETGQDGSRAITVCRFQYELVVGCVFRDLERTLAHLAASGLVGPAPGEQWPEQAPFAPEHAAVVMPGGTELLQVELSFTDRHGSRRVTYQDFTRGGMEALLAIETATEASALRAIERAEAFSAEYIGRIDDVLNEAIREQRGE